MKSKLKFNNSIKIIKVPELKLNLKKSYTLLKNSHKKLIRYTCKIKHQMCTSVL
jgi:hypothetical protein